MRDCSLRSRSRCSIDGVVATSHLHRVVPSNLLAVTGLPQRAAVVPKWLRSYAEIYSSSPHVGCGIAGFVGIIWGIICVSSALPRASGSSWYAARASAHSSRTKGVCVWIVCGLSPFYLSLVQSTPLYPTITLPRCIHSTLVNYYALLYAIIPYSTLLCSTPVYFSPIQSNVLYTTLLYPALV